MEKTRCGLDTINTVTMYGRRCGPSMRWVIALPPDKSLVVEDFPGKLLDGVLASLRFVLR